MAVLVAMAVVGIGGIGILFSAIAYEIKQVWEETKAGKDTRSHLFRTGGTKYAVVLAMRNNIGKDNCELI